MKSIHETSLGSVSILIGPNGSGKSRKLRGLCDEALYNGMKVIAVAPTIYDRFLNVRSSDFKFFGSRLGRGASIRVIRDMIIHAAHDNPLVLKNFIRVLQYTKFDPMIGVSIKWAEPGRLFKVTEKLGLEDEESSDLEFALKHWRDRSTGDGEYRWEGKPYWDGFNEYNEAKILNFTMEKFSFEELNRLTSLNLLKYESSLVKEKVMARPQYYFYREGNPIPLLEACSGEISFVTSMAFISTKIEEDSCIMIDEPENSLHPTWQKNYIKTIFDLFSYYSPRVVISTHSPIVVSGGEIAEEQTKVYEMSNGITDEINDANLNMEEMYERLFDVVTPKNHYLSERIIGLLNSLNEKSQDLSNVFDELEMLNSKCYDEKQRSVISGVRELAVKIDRKAKG